MTGMIIASIVLTALFAGVVVRARKVPDSISALVYLLPRGGQCLWILWMWATSLLTCIPVIEVMPHGLKGIGFAAIVCLMLCGAMPISDRHISRQAHNIFGILGGLLSQVCVGLICAEWLLAWWIIPVLFLLSKLWPWLGRRLDGRGVLVAECICAMTVWGSLFVRYAAT